MNKFRTKSLKRTPWDDKEELSPIEEFIKINYIDEYNHKHPKLTETNENELINSFTITKCKYCNSENIRKKGFTRNNIQRYICNDCGKSFTPVTNTIFENHKVSIIEWLEFCLNIVKYQSITACARNNKNAFYTSKFWVNLLFDILKEYQKNMVLSKNVYIDETFYKVMINDREIVNGKELRGLSKNQICIGIGYDKKNVYAKFEGYGKTSQKKTKEAFLNHIERKSTLIHDEEKSHKILIKELELSSISYPSKTLKGINDKDNPLYPINHQCFLLKSFLKEHSGFNRDDLQDYLNLFCFIQNPPSEPLEKIELLLKWAMETPKLHTYREFFLENTTKK